MIGRMNMPTFGKKCVSCDAILKTPLHDECEECVSQRVPKLPVEEILANKGVPERYRSCRFGNYVCSLHNKTFVENLKKINGDFKDSVFLGSKSNGVGKTHLAVAIMANLVESGYLDMCFVSSPWIFLEIKSAFDKGENAEKTIIDRYTKIKFLIIDDIGVEKVSEWSLVIWYMIIDKRHTAMLPTIYTSNLLIENFANIDTRIASRLGSGYVYTVQGSDYRIKKFNQGLSHAK